MAFLTEQDRKYRTAEDICAHLGDEYGKFQGAIVPPIYQNSLFVQPTVANGIEQTDYVYTRVGNPTTDIAERKIAALEGGDGALCFPSGMSAISSAMLHFIEANCHIIMVDTAYGGAAALARDYFPKKCGTSCTFVHGGDIEEIRAAIRPDTRLIYVESPSSLMFRMQDLEAIAALAKEHGVGTVIDNTNATPLHQQPLKYGIDIVCHTASKYMGGHSDIVAGVVVSRREIIERIQNNERSLIGGVMDPHQAWLLIRGLRTLPLRLRQHGESGMRMAEFLENHPKVTKVWYPGSKTYDQKELFEKYMSGTNGLIMFSPACGAEEAKKLVGSLRYFQNGVSWGGFESLCYYMGETPEGKPIVRIHVGLESMDTLMDDLNRALNAI